MPLTALRLSTASCAPAHSTGSRRCPPRHEFRRCVNRYNGNRRVRTFSCWDQFLCLLFAQLTFRESLRDIEACLRALGAKLYHAGIRGRVSRNTLAVANEKRDWRIYAEFAQILIAHARRLYADEPLGVELNEAEVYALDSTTIDLCLNLFPWARFRTTKGAIKLHTLLDIRGNIPTFIHITDGKVSDVRILDVLLPEPGSIYIMDRGYIDFARLWHLGECRSTFVVRAKGNLKFRRVYSRPVDKTTGLICDQIGVLTDPKSAAAYPAQLRRVRFRDPETGKEVTLLTNDINLSALTIAALYRSRWHVERAFRTLKTTLELQPLYNRLPERIRAHVHLSWLAFLLVRVSEREMGQTWARLRDELEAVALVDLRGKDGALQVTTTLTEARRKLLHNFTNEPPTRARAARPAPQNT